MEEDLTRSLGEDATGRAPSSPIERSMPTTAAHSGGVWGDSRPPTPAGAAKPKSSKKWEAMEDDLTRTLGEDADGHAATSPLGLSLR